MDDAAQALAYANADFAEVNQGFVDRFVATFPEFSRGRVVDLGCGPADIPLRLRRALPAIRIVALDGAPAMLECARGAAAQAPGMELLAARVPSLPFGDGAFDACISNSLLHHLRAPVECWKEIRRIGRRGAPLYVMDLVRPASRRAARDIVEHNAGAESDILQRDFYNSLLAAFTVQEVGEQLVRAGLEGCRCSTVSHRHWLVVGRIG